MPSLTIASCGTARQCKVPWHQQAAWWLAGDCLTGTLVPLHANTRACAMLMQRSTAGAAALAQATSTAGCGMRLAFSNASHRQELDITAAFAQHVSHKARNSSHTEASVCFAGLKRRWRDQHCVLAGKGVGTAYAHI